ncbi:MAG: DUF1698 domain-containing protein, partial [Xanthomonadales bacterium]|nr:DUF1698 domain-containing protein [Xanthomonadales bacterium]
CKPGGQVVLETLVLEAQGTALLEPSGRYARMRNVHAIPSPELLVKWMDEAGLQYSRVLDISRTTTAEQRSTEWMRFESLDRCLDPLNPDKTIEGHPAPVRAALLAKAPE